MPGLARGSSKVKVGLDEVVCVDAAQAAYAATQQQAQQQSSGSEQRESAYADLLERVNAALAALEEQP